MNEKLKAIIKDKGKPDAVYFNTVVDIILIKDIHELDSIQPIINAERYEKNTVNLQYGRGIVTVKEDPKPTGKKNKDE